MMDETISAENFINHAVDTYSDTVYRVALNITHDPHDSFDISQEVFLRLIRNQQKIKDNSHLKAWLIRVTVNCSRTYMKNKRSFPMISLEDIQESVSVNLPNNELELTEMVMNLPERLATVIYLFYYEDMKISEISKSLGITQSAVKLRLSRGREMLRKKFEKEKKND